MANSSAEGKNWKIQVKRQTDHQIDFSLDVSNNGIITWLITRELWYILLSKWTAYKNISPLLKRNTVLSLRAA